VYIAMEIAGHGDLLEYIKLRGAVGEERGRTMFQQLVDAVDYLHQHNIVHRLVRTVLCHILFHSYALTYVIFDNKKTKITLSK
jgi:serine/threonine protein kinase